MAAKDDSAEAELPCEGSHVSSRALVGVCLDIEGRSVRPAISARIRFVSGHCLLASQRMMAASQTYMESGATTSSPSFVKKGI